jgi:cell division protein FtsB
MRKIIFVALILISSLSSVVAADLDPIAQTKALLDQYSSRVRSLEAENSILREEMRKANIKIPLALFS